MTSVRKTIVPYFDITDFYRCYRIISLRTEEGTPRMLLLCSSLTQATKTFVSKSAGTVIAATFDR